MCVIAVDPLGELKHVAHGSRKNASADVVDADASNGTPVFRGSSWMNRPTRWVSSLGPLLRRADASKSARRNSLIATELCRSAAIVDDSHRGPARSAIPAT